MQLLYKICNILQHNCSWVVILKQECQYFLSGCVDWNIKEKRMKQANYYNKSSKILKEMKINDEVLFLKDNRWEEGTIVEVLENRSYLVMDRSGQKYRRNRRHITGSSLKKYETYINYDFLDDVATDDYNSPLELSLSDECEGCRC